MDCFAAARLAMTNLILKDKIIHIHIHNEADGLDDPITPAEVAAAGLVAHKITYGATAADFQAQAATVEALVLPPWEVKKMDLFAAPKLRLVQSTSAGVDSLQPFAMFPPGVLLANNRGTHAAKAGEYALMAILMLVNWMPRFAAAQRAHDWTRITAGLAATKRLTIIGLGSLGGAAAAQARRMGMAVTGIRHGAAPHPDCARTLTFSALDQALPETDILVLACPLTPETRQMLNAARLALLPPGAGVINIGRGGLIDEAALLAALNTGHLGGAILDVVSQEPLPAGHPAWDTKNLIITPHMSSDDPATYNAKTLAIFARNLAALAAGEPPPTLVAFDKGY
jgi:phosphoglycerate dehydrogenase-like enzyme